MQAINVTLGSEIVFVAGSVNGVAVTFDLVAPGTWQTKADRSPNNTYSLEILAYDAGGNFTAYATSISYGFAVVADRTQADEDLAVGLKNRIDEEGWDSLSEAEQTLWLGGLKAFYNSADLNRVEAAVDYLAGLFNSYGYKVILDTKRDWLMSDITFKATLERYLNNVKKLVEVYYTMPDTPPLPLSINNLRWQGANAIEENLRDMEILLNNMVAQFRYCGTIFCGE